MDREIELEHKDGQRTPLILDAESWVDVRTANLVALPDTSSLNDTRVGIKNALNFSIWTLDGVRQKITSGEGNDGVTDISNKATLIEGRIKETAAGMSGEDFLEALKNNAFNEDRIQQMLDNEEGGKGVALSLPEAIIMLRVFSSVSDGVADREGILDKIDAIDKKFTALSHSKALVGDIDFGSNTN